MEEKEDSLIKKKKKKVINRKGKMLKKKECERGRNREWICWWNFEEKKKESESAIFKKLGRINQLSYTQKKLSL